VPVKAALTGGSDMNLYHLERFFKTAALLSIIFVNIAAAQNLVPELLDQGLKLYSTKDYRGASAYLGQVVDMQPDHDQARYYLVFSLSMTGQYEKSLFHAKKLAAKFPGQKQYTDLVLQLENAINAERKKKEQQRAAKSIPQEVILGGYESLDTPREARMSTATRDIAPPKELTPLEKAVLMIDEEKYASASALLDNILGKTPKNARAMHYKGVIKFNSGQFEDARKWFEKSVEIDSNSFQTVFLLGDCYRAQENYNKAAEQFKKAISIKKDVFAQINLADCYVKENKLKEAEKIYQEVLDKDPDISEAALGLAQIKLYAGYTNEAVKMVNKVLANESGNAEAHYIKAQILLEGHLNEDAAEQAKLALENFQGNLKYRSLYALALIRAYRTAQGLEEAAGIIRQYPDNTDARLAIAEGLIMSGAYSDAEEHLQAVQKRGPNAGVPRLRAMKAVKDGKMKEAGEYYRTYIQLSAGRPKPYLEYAEFLESVDNLEDARQAYEEIAELFKETAYAKTAKQKIAEIEARTSGSSTSGQTQGDTSSYRKGKVKF
jgi:tetratricopeptide (TPR) repeat protein